MTHRVCPSCGTPLAASAGPGACTRCLAEVLLGELESESPEGASRSHPGETTSGPGSRLGRYEILEEIARGGMGVVYRARQPGLAREVALKVILAGPFADAQSIGRLRVEASSAARLQHPGIVGIHEIGEAAGHHFIAMELVRGRTLGEMTRGGPLPPKRAAHYVEQVARAVQYAHEQGVFHRDLKPSNILVGADDRPRVTDFGLAKLEGGEESLTLTGQALGTPSFAAPEQLAPRLGEVTARSDVYGLGALLYHLLVGKPPFLANSVTETISQVLHSDPVAPRLLNRMLPRDLDTLVLRCLAKEPGARYATAGEVADELERWREGRPIRARPVGLPARFWRGCRRRPVVAALALTTGLAALGILMALPAAWINHRRMLEATVGRMSAAAGAWTTAARPGQRFDALEFIAQAVRLQPSEADRETLRDHALAALALPDVLSVRRMDRPQGEWWAILPDLGKYLATPDGAPPWLRDLDGSGPGVSLDRVPILDKVLSIADGGRLVFARLPVHAGEPAPGASGEGMTEVPLVTGGWVAFRPLENRVVFTSARVPLAPPSVSPDGAEVAICVSDMRGAPKLEILHLADGRLLREFALEGVVEQLAWSPDGTRLAVAIKAARDFLILDAGTGWIRQRWRIPMMLGDVAWHPDGRRVAAGGLDGSLLVWEPEQEAEGRIRRNHHNAVLHVIFSPDGEWLVSSGWDRQICLSDPSTLERLLAIPTEQTDEPALSRDGTRMWAKSWGARDSPGVVEEFKVAPSRELRWRRQPDRGYANGSVDHPEDRRFAFDPTSRWLASADRTGVSIWHLSSGQEVARVPALHASMPLFDPSGRQLLVSSKHGIVSWPIREADGATTLGPPATVFETGGQVQRVMMILAPRADLLLFSAGISLHRYRLGTRAHEGSQPLSVEPLFLAAGSEGGLAWAAGWDTGMNVLREAESGIPRPRWSWAMTPVWDESSGRLLVRADSKTESKGLEDQRWVWINPTNGTVLAHLAAASSTLWSPVFGRDGASLYMPSPLGGAIVLSTHPPSGRERRMAVLTTRVGEGECTSLALSPDEAWMATRRGPDLVQIWNLRSLRESLRKLGLDGDWSRGATNAVAAGAGGEPSPTPWRVLLDPDVPAPRLVRTRLRMTREESGPSSASNSTPGAAAPDFRVDLPPLIDPGFHPLNLGAVTNAPLAPAWYLDPAPHRSCDLRDLEIGVARHGGTLFDVRGVLQVGGYRSDGRPFPTRISGLPVGRRCRALHFLGAHSSTFHGENVFFGRYVVRYADGSEAHLPAISGVSLGALRWSGSNAEGEPPLATPVWSGRLVSKHRPVLHRWVWANPRPDAVIESLDFIAEDQELPHFVVGVTAEDPGGFPPAAPPRAGAVPE